MSLFHSLKKTIVNSKTELRPDNDFIDAKTRFEQYADTCIKLKGNIHNYLSHANSLYICSSQIAQDFSTLLEDPDHPNKNSASITVQSMRQEHQTLASEQVSQLTNQFQTTILIDLENEITRNTDITKRISRRMELFGEQNYYQQKLNELREEREKRAGKGKSESASDTEKFDRSTENTKHTHTHTVSCIDV